MSEDIKDIAKQDIEISERTIKEIHALILHGIDRGMPEGIAQFRL